MIDKQQIESFIIQKAAGHVDKIVNATEVVPVHADDISYVKYHLRDLNYVEEINFSNPALDQLLTRIHIPSQFYDRCPAYIKYALFIYFNNKYNNQYTFRFDNSISKNHVRAVLSDKYSIIDDIDLIPIVFEALDKRDDIVYRRIESDEKITQLAIDFKDTAQVYNGVEYTSGLRILNSETGYSSVWIEPIVYANNYFFCNRNILKKQNIDCKIVHRGKSLLEKVRPMIDTMKEIAQVGAVQLAESSNIMMNKEHAIELVEKIDKIPTRFINVIKEEWENDLQISKLRLASEILEFAKKLPLFNRIQTEEEVGKITGIFNNYKSRFTNLMSQF